MADLPTPQVAVSSNRILLYKESLITTDGGLPSETDVSCWHCTYPFSGPPKVVPTNYDHQREKFTVIGCFCSFACAKAWQQENVAFNNGTTVMYLSILAAKLYNYNRPIEAAPPRYFLRRFGGPLTIDEFRAKHPEDRCELLYNALLPASIVATFGRSNQAASELLAIRNESTEDETPASRQGMYAQYLEQRNDKDDTPAAETSSETKTRRQPRVRKTSARQASVAPPATTEGTRGSLANFIRK